MFLNELSPLVKEITQQPVAFMGGFVSGLLRLKLSDDPVKSWLEKQGVNPSTVNFPQSGSSTGPQSISID